MAAAAARTSPAPFNQLSFDLAKVATGALAGGIAAVTTSELPFVGGLVFGGVFFVVQPLVDLALKNLMGESQIAETARGIIVLLASAVAAMAVTTTAGFTVTLNTGVVLAIAMMVSYCVLGSLYIGGFCACFGCYFLATHPH